MYRYIYHQGHLTIRRTHIVYDLQQKISKKSGNTVNQLTCDYFLSLIEYKLFCSHYIVIFMILK